MLFGDVVQHKNPMIWNIHNKKLIQEQISFCNKVKDSTDSNIQKCLSFQIVYFGKAQKTSSSFNSEKHFLHLFTFSNAPTVLPNKRFFFELSKVLTAFNAPKVWTFEHSTFQSSKKHVFFVFEFLDFSKVPNNMFWFLNFEFSKVKTKIRIQWSNFPIIWTFTKTRTKQRDFFILEFSRDACPVPLSPLCYRCWTSTKSRMIFWTFFPFFSSIFLFCEFSLEPCPFPWAWRSKHFSFFVSVLG